MRSPAVLLLFAALLLLAACQNHPPAPPQAAATPPSPHVQSAQGAAPQPRRRASRLFSSPSADWLYSAPTGTPVDISSTTAGMQFTVNTHNGGFDYPVQYTEGYRGCTLFTDTLRFRYRDHICVPNPPGGYWPSVGGKYANDGHLIVVNRRTRRYYDFWKLTVDSQGQPVSTNVGQIVSGSLDTSDGTPGTTAAVITGLAGDILPGELDCDNCLQHALQAIVPVGMNSPRVCTQAPARKTDGKAPDGIFCEGAKLRFDPSIDVDDMNVSTATKAILHALQKYGAVITDQGGSAGIGFYSALPSAPPLRGLEVIGHHLWIYY